MSQPGMSRDLAVLAGILGVSGVVHLVRPALYEPLMPTWVPAHRAVILGSGVAEIGCAVGLLATSTRRPAGWASTALLAGVYVGNLKMAADAARSNSPVFKALAFGRLPLQLLMLRSALRAARG